MIGVVVFLLWINSNSESHYTQLQNHKGKIAKFEFDGHSYIGWTCNLGAGLVHDPDCKCFQKNIP